MGQGGPWLDTKVKAGVPSDPYLMTGYDKKILQLRFDDPKNDALNVTMQVDIDGTGNWQNYLTLELETSHTVGHIFPDDFQAYWVRFISDEDSTATAQLIYR